MSRIVCVTAGFCLIVSAVPVVGAVVFSDNFNSYADQSTLGGQGGWLVPTGDGTTALTGFGTPAGNNLLIDADGGIGGSGGAFLTGDGIHGNAHLVPGDPIASGIVTVEADLRLLSTASGFHFLRVGAQNATATPGAMFIGLQIENDDFTIEGSTLGGLPLSLPLTGGSDVTGSNFHLTLAFDLDAKTVNASISGDASASTGPQIYTNAFSVSALALVGLGPFNASDGTTWDNVTITTGVIPELAGDLNGDGFVGQDDLNIVLGDWGNMPPGDPRADPSGDGFVGQDDLNPVLADWGQGTPPVTLAGSSLSAAAVPEPQSLLLAVIAIAGALPFCRIQRHRARGGPQAD